MLSVTLIVVEVARATAAIAEAPTHATAITLVVESVIVSINDFDILDN
jgi:hypothetical protein